MNRHYRTAEFAKLGGVTVRTLHYYDRIGLLKPSAMTESGHRRYLVADLLPLQQIVTLKWMGFSLAHIKRVLNSPTYDLPQALIAQKAAVEKQIERLEAAAAALQFAIEAAQGHDTTQLEPDTIRAIIQAVTDQGAVMDRYFSETALAGIALRRLSYTEAEMAQIQQDWQAVYNGFGALIDQPPDHPQVMELAAKMDELIKAFTGGDQETASGVQQLIQDAEAGRLPDMPQAQTFFADVDPDLRRFMRQALAVYQKKQNRGKT